MLLRFNGTQHLCKDHIKFDTMDKLAEILIFIDNSEDLTKSELLSILELVSTKIDIDTISGMARKENKTPRGIKTSNQYRKIKIGSQLMAVKGVKQTNLPF